MSAALAGKRILVVEDELLFANNVVDALKRMGAIALGPAKTAADALLATMMGIDAAMLDVRLPDGDVYKVADELRRRSKPFVFVSGYGDESVPDHLSDAPFVSKPCSDAAWAAALAQLLEPAGRGKAAAMRALERRRHTPDIRSETIARRLGSLLALSPGETEFLHRIGAGPASLWAPKSLIEQPAGEHASPRYIISGWAARVRELDDGRRQIVQLVLPGDPLAPQLQVRHRQQTVQCLTMVQTVDGGAIRLAARDPVKFPGIAAAVELAAAHDRALLLDQVTRLGRQDAYERVASLFVELLYRSLPVGLVHSHGFAFPLTQEGIGDVLGLSVVHVNRTLQIMRQQNLITLKQGRLTLHDVPALQAAAQFKAPELKYLG